MKWRPNGIYKKSDGTLWTPKIDPHVWQGDEIPELVSLQSVDDPLKVIVITKAQFEADFEDTDDDAPLAEGTAVFE